MHSQVEKTVAEVNCHYPLAAHMLPCKDDGFFSIESTWKYTDLSSIKNVSYGTHSVFQRNGADLKLISSSSYNKNSVCLSTVSKSGDIKVVLRREKNEKNAPCLFIDIYKNTRCVHSYDMTETKSHGDIYYKGDFVTFALSGDGTRLLYAAEKNAPKTVSFFKKSEPSECVKAENDDLPVRGGEFVYKEDWGERHINMCHSVLCVMDLDNGNVTVLPEVQESNVTVGQAIWSADSHSIVFIGWYESPYRLGVHICQMRRNSIFGYKLGSENPILLTTDKFSVHSLRFSPDGKFLVYLQNVSWGPHLQGRQLMKMNFETKESTVIIDLVQQCGREEFPGIYTLGLPERCFASNGKYVAFHSFWRSKRVVLCVDLQKCTVQRMKVDDTIGSCTVMDVFDDQIIISCSSPNIKPHLMIGKLDFSGDVTVQWNDLTSPIYVDGIKWQIFALKPIKENETYPGLDFEIVLITPKEFKETLPLILLPHGGPHVTLDPLYCLDTATFVKMGFAVCKVNYRGSLGFGENNLLSLPGNIGTQDVLDVHYSAEFARKKLTVPGEGIAIEINDVFICGGSHGGFIGAHLIGQYPDYYRACVLRNPATDIISKTAAGDIPDIGWFECGLVERFMFQTPDEGAISKMFQMSPIYHLKNVKSPTLLLVSLKDCRVPPSQALSYYRYMKAQNVPVRMHVYEDNHSLLSTAAISTDVLMQTVLFFMDHCAKP